MTTTNLYMWNSHLDLVALFNVDHSRLCCVYRCWFEVNYKSTLLTVNDIVIIRYGFLQTLAQLMYFYNCQEQLNDFNSILSHF